MHCAMLSKLDENTGSSRLNFILPSHEYFHQSFVIADCASKLFRETSRGLEGGVFFEATLLNRKEAKTRKGKDCFDKLKDFMLTKAEVRFCHYFLHLFGSNPNVDNTPPLLKTANWWEKESFLHSKTE